MKSLVLTIVVAALLIGCSSDENNSTTRPGVNHAPVIRSLIANPTTVGRQQSTEITCVATDADDDSLSFFWWAASGSVYGNDATVIWLAPNVDGDYWVGVTISDGREIDVDSLRLTVTAPNEPPTTPWDPQPRDYQRDIDMPVVLTWKCSDVDGDPILYDLFFGTTSHPSIIQRDLDTAYFVVDNLNSSVNYFWRVNARDDHGNTSYGPTWNLTTR